MYNKEALLVTVIIVILYMIQSGRLVPMLSHACAIVKTSDEKVGDETV